MRNKLALAAALATLTLTSSVSFAQGATDAPTTRVDTRADTDHDFPWGLLGLIGLAGLLGRKNRVVDRTHTTNTR